MTTIFKADSICAVCQKGSTHHVLGSTNAFGYCDLDARPPEMQRSTMRMWIQECPHCGYVAAQLDGELPCDKAFFESEAYRAPMLPAPADSLIGNFVKQARTLAHCGEHRGEFFACVHAAWAADDARDKAWQDEARQRALHAFSEIAPEEIDDSLRLMRADLLRKTQQFERLIAEYEEFSSNDELLDRIMRFEIAKAREQDTRTYTVGDVEKAQ